MREFSGLDPAATCLRSRWLLLRAVGVVYLIIFAGVIRESPAILGPNGIAPAADLFAQLARDQPGAVAAVLKAPTLLWFGAGKAMLTMLGWAGLTAAIALVLNLWPRLSLFTCWAIFLSFVAAWGEFSPAQLDGLMLETALLCLFFAPSGIRPGLGAHSPPRPIAVFMIRWLLLRIMLQSGLVKLLSADPAWREFTAMDFMYETSPLPTLLGYWAHQLPHAWHVGEIALTFAAEIQAPILAVFAGRRGRWIAFVLWTVFQLGIALTANFGWLNLAAIALGLLLLDDSMLAAPAARLGWRARAPAPVSIATLTPWRRHGLRVVLSAHFLLTLHVFVFPGPAIASSFRSANRYSLYEHVHPVHLQVEFEGTGDGGRTWRPYEYRHLPQRVDRPPRFVAPWFPRFENTLLFESERPAQVSVITAVASQLLRRNPDVLARFTRDPFPERPPTVIRMRRYRYGFTDPATLRRTGQYWRKEFAGDYLPALHVTPDGAIAHFDLSQADAALKRGDVAAALAEYERQYRLGHLDAGFRLADLHARGQGVPPDPARVFALASALAEAGEVRALHSLGLCHEHGVGVPADVRKAADYYRRAAESGHLLAMQALGSLAARDQLQPGNDVEALAWLFTALRRATGDDATAQYIRREHAGPAQRLLSRMSPAEIAEAKARAQRRR